MAWPRWQLFMKHVNAVKTNQNWTHLAQCLLISAGWQSCQSWQYSENAFRMQCGMTEKGYLYFSGWKHLKFKITWRRVPLPSSKEKEDKKRLGWEGSAVRCLLGFLRAGPCFVCVEHRDTHANASDTEGDAAHIPAIHMFLLINGLGKKHTMKRSNVTKGSEEENCRRVYVGVNNALGPLFWQILWLRYANYITGQNFDLSNTLVFQQAPIQLMTSPSASAVLAN